MKHGFISVWLALKCESKSARPVFYAIVVQSRSCTLSVSCFFRLALKPRRTFELYFAFDVPRASSPGGLKCYILSLFILEGIFFVNIMISNFYARLLTSLYNKQNSLLRCCSSSAFCFRKPFKIEFYRIFLPFLSKMSTLGYYHWGQFFWGFLSF